jgi:hypothetical protein
VGWGVLLVFLCILWLRSYTTADELVRHSRYFTGSVTIRAGNLYQIGDFGEGLPPYLNKWKLYHYPAELYDHNSGGIEWESEEMRIMSVSYPISVIAIIAALPWLNWRFSLRTLLVIMTFFASLLGVIVWASR